MSVRLFQVVVVDHFFQMCYQNCKEVDLVLTDHRRNPT